MSKTAVTDSASAADLETPNSMNEAMETGFLPDDPHYRLTGEFKSEKKDDSASSAKEDQPEKPDASAASESETAAASEAASTQTEEKRTQKTAAASESRWQKLSRENRELKERLRAQAQSKPAQEAQRETEQTSQAATEPKSKTAPKPKIDDIDPKTGKPRYANYNEYEDAKDAWLKQDAIREFQETSAKTARETAEQQQFRERATALAKKLEAPRAKYADFDQVALSEDLTIPAGSVAEMFIHDSDQGGEVLYYLGQHPEVLAGFYRDYDPKTGKFQSLMTPQRQFRALMEIEARVSGSGSGEKSSSSSSAKPVTQASRPPHQVSGKGTVAKEAVEQALEDGDFETYSRAQNAKELARLKRK